MEPSQASVSSQAEKLNNHELSEDNESVVKLIRTDTTLDLSQKAEKVLVDRPRLLGFLILQEAFRLIMGFSASVVGCF